MAERALLKFQLEIFKSASRVVSSESPGDDESCRIDEQIAPLRLLQMNHQHRDMTSMTRPHKHHWGVHSENDRNSEDRLTIGNAKFTTNAIHSPLVIHQLLSFRSCVTGETVPFQVPIFPLPPGPLPLSERRLVDPDSGFQSSTVTVTNITGAGQSNRLWYSFPSRKSRPQNCKRPFDDTTNEKFTLTCPDTHAEFPCQSRHSVASCPHPFPSLRPLLPWSLPLHGRRVVDART
jgi:hypothetical protein